MELGLEWQPETESEGARAGGYALTRLRASVDLRSRIKGPATTRDAER